MNQGRIQAICSSAKKGMVKHEMNEAIIENDWGIMEDAHAGKWHRQVSLLAGESIDRVKKLLPALKNGAFAENIITRGLDLTAMQIGERLLLGDEVVLEITQIGKHCHNDGCAIKRATGNCSMPKEGLFSRVIHGGRLKKGDGIRRLSTVLLQEQED